MQISLVDRQNLLPAATRELAARRLRFALSRFDSKIERLQLMVAVEDAPRAGTDTKCSVTVKLKRLPEVRVASQGSDLESVIAYVADRAGRAVQRAIEKSHNVDRARLRAVWSS